jgi:hypothetical protein
MPAQKPFSLAVATIFAALMLAVPLMAQASAPDDAGTAFKPNLSGRSLPIPGGDDLSSSPQKNASAANITEACAREP